jgi:hypothetical protein
MEPRFCFKSLFMFRQFATRLLRYRRPFAFVVWTIALILTAWLACSAWEAVNAASESERLYSTPNLPFSR